MNSESVIVVTAADYTHERSLMDMLVSLYKHEPDAGTVVWDLGMSSDILFEISERFPSIILKRFPFEKYPPHFDVSVGLGGYAWKPVCIVDALEQFGGVVVWTDAGNRFTGNLKPIMETAIKCGMYAARTTGTLAEWTHPQTLKYMNVPEYLHSRQKRAATLVAFDREHEGATQLARQWMFYCMVRECVVPEGCSYRKNHRMDQSVLSALIALYGFDRTLPDERFNWVSHQDSDSNEFKAESGKRKAQGVCLPSVESQSREAGQAECPMTNEEKQTIISNMLSTPKGRLALADSMTPYGGTPHRMVCCSCEWNWTAKIDVDVCPVCQGKVEDIGMPPEMRAVVWAEHNHVGSTIQPTA